MELRGEVLLKRNHSLLAVAVTTVIGISLLAGCGAPQAASNSGSTGSGSTNNTLVIGGKNFTENDIMADMLDLLIQHDDPKLHIIMDTWLDSNVVWNAMANNKIDLYVEYTGTGLVNILHDAPMTNPNAVYHKVKKAFQQKYHITWLKPIGFNDTYAMAMRASEAKRLGITNISQMAAQSGNLVLGCEVDFQTRSDTLPAMNKLYHTHFKSVDVMAIGLKYQALINKKVDVIDAFSTDGQIPAYKLVILKDNKHLFPPYYAAPIIRDSVLRAHPELRGIINKLAGKINDSEMQKLNMEVDLGHKKAMDVARTWLTQHGLI